MTQPSFSVMLIRTTGCFLSRLIVSLLARDLRVILRLHVSPCIHPSTYVPDVIEHQQSEVQSLLTPLTREARSVTVEPNRVESSQVRAFTTGLVLFEKSRSTMKKFNLLALHTIMCRRRRKHLGAPNKHEESGIRNI